MPSTADITQRLLDSDTEDAEVIAAPPAGIVETEEQDDPANPLYEKAFLVWHYLYNFATTLLRTGYPTALLVSELHGEFWIGSMTPTGIAAGVAAGLFFGYCESDSHNAQSLHFNESARQHHAHTHVDIESQLPAETETTAQKRSIMNHIKAGGHFLSDVMEGIEPPLVIAKNVLNIDAHLPAWARGLTYVAMGLFSVGGNAQELKNTIIAYKQQNTRETEQQHRPGLK